MASPVSAGAGRKSRGNLATRIKSFLGVGMGLYIENGEVDRGDWEINGSWSGLQHQEVVSQQSRFVEVIIRGADDGISRFPFPAVDVIHSRHVGINHEIFPRNHVDSLPFAPASGVSEHNPFRLYGSLTDPSGVKASPKYSLPLRAQETIIGNTVLMTSEPAISRGKNSCVRPVGRWSAS
jgi:hypothetical protein